MKIGRVADLKGERVFFVVRVERDTGGELETVKIVPIVGPKEHINRRCIVLKATHSQGFLTHSQRPIFMKTVVEIKEICVVEEGVAARVGHNALPKIVRQILCEVAAHVQVEVTAHKSIGTLANVRGLQTFQLTQDEGLVEGHVGTHLEEQFIDQIKTALVFMESVLCQRRNGKNRKEGAAEDGFLQKYHLGKKKSNPKIAL